MFSINPGHDYHHGEFAKGSSGEREALYLRCEKDGVGISVMKAFSGGQLLDGKSSPFGKALTKYQCIQYALEKKAQGLVKHAGFSFHDTPELPDEILTKHPEMEFVQLQIN